MSVLSANEVLGQDRLFNQGISTQESDGFAPIVVPQHLTHIPSVHTVISDSKQQKIPKNPLRTVSIMASAGVLIVTAQFRTILWTALIVKA